MNKVTLVAAVAICGAALVATTGSAISTETLIERGTYLVTTIGACGNCHTPRDKAGRVMPGMALAGGFEFDEAGIGHHHINLGMRRSAEADSAIDRQPFPVAAVKVQIHADLACPAQGQEG